MKRKLKLTILTVIILLFVLIVALIIIENNMVQLNKYDVSTSKLPSDLNLKIAHISDFHNTKLKDKALERLAEAEPDIIVVTGDLIDSRKTDVKLSVDFMEKAMKIAPCYYVTGNHESRMPNELNELLASLNELGVTALRNESVLLDINGEKINIIGIDDPKFALRRDSVKGASIVVSGSLEPLISEEYYNLVLCHRPEAFEVYVECGADLALCGHAHGGQIILPLIGGVVAPNQGLFPKYYAGLYSEGETNMIVSRGVGNSLFPFRVNNKPEVILINLKGE